MQDIERALADIASIREQVAASTLFRGLGPAALALTGLLALCVAVLQSLLPGEGAAEPVFYFFIWVATAVAVAVILGGEVMRRRRTDRSPLADAVLQNAVQLFLPAGAAGAALLIFFGSFVPEALWMLPGLWQILVALGIFASTRLLPGQTILAAAWYFLSGFCVLLIASRDHALSPWLMGAPFFVGQSIMAVVTWRATETLHGQ